MEKDIIVIGAGLTGLTTAVYLKKKGFDVAVVEKSDRVGGQIRTYREGGFVFESGPNSGNGASEAVLDLCDTVSAGIQFARKESERRLIWKNGKFHPLPHSLWSGLTTPLFTFSDKIGILGEPWRKKGTNPDESVAQLTLRRLGKSFLDYAVDPFISGIYAGDAETLITRHALPKLYNLEQRYGSFIRGAMAKAKETKKNRPKRKHTDVFSIADGMENLPQAMARYIGEENIFLSCENATAVPKDNVWSVHFARGGADFDFVSGRVVTTVGAHALPPLLPFIEEDGFEAIANLAYAPVIQTAVGIRDRGGRNFNAFGGLVGSKENKDILGILFPSSCFTGRAPEEGMLFSFFMGGTRKKALMQLNDDEVTGIALRAFHEMLAFPAAVEPDIIRIFRHRHAIPQYEVSAEERLKAIGRIEKTYSGLYLAGNLRDGVGMAHRIIQGKKLAEEIKAKT